MNTVWILLLRCLDATIGRLCTHKSHPLFSFQIPSCCHSLYTANTLTATESFETDSFNRVSEKHIILPLWESSRKRTVPQSSSALLTSGWALPMMAVDGNGFHCLLLFLARTPPFLPRFPGYIFAGSSGQRVGRQLAIHGEKQSCCVTAARRVTTCQPPKCLTPVNKCKKKKRIATSHTTTVPKQARLQ